MKWYRAILLMTFTAVGLGQTPEDVKFAAWCAHYGRVRVMVSNAVECARHYSCEANKEIGNEIRRLNAETDQNSLRYFWKEDGAVWELINCHWVIVDEQLIWTNRILDGSSHKPLPVTDAMRGCLILAAVSASPKMAPPVAKESR